MVQPIIVDAAGNVSLNQLPQVYEQATQRGPSRLDRFRQGLSGRNNTSLKDVYRAAVNGAKSLGRGGAATGRVGTNAARGAGNLGLRAAGAGGRFAGAVLPGASVAAARLLPGASVAQAGLGDFFSLQEGDDFFSSGNLKTTEEARAQTGLGDGSTFLDGTSLESLGIAGEDTGVRALSYLQDIGDNFVDPLVSLFSNSDDAPTEVTATPEAVTAAKKSKQGRKGKAGKKVYTGEFETAFREALDNNEKVFEFKGKHKGKARKGHFTTDLAGASTTSVTDDRNLQAEAAKFLAQFQQTTDSAPAVRQSKRFGSVGETRGGNRIGAGIANPENNDLRAKYYNQRRSEVLGR